MGLLSIYFICFVNYTGAEDRDNKIMKWEGNVPELSWRRNHDKPQLEYLVSELR